MRWLSPSPPSTTSSSCHISFQTLMYCSSSCNNLLLFKKPIYFNHLHELTQKVCIKVSKKDYIKRTHWFGIILLKINWCWLRLGNMCCSSTFWRNWCINVRESRWWVCRSSKARNTSRTTSPTRSWSPRLIRPTCNRVLAQITTCNVTTSSKWMSLNLYTLRPWLWFMK